MMQLFDTRLPARFWDKVIPEPNSACWIWIGGLSSGGYGQFFAPSIAHKNMRPAHRVCFEAIAGPVDPILELDHLCRTPCCVNPAHLEPVTPQVNALRSGSVAEKNAKKLLCPRGHSYIARSYRGQAYRRCLECHRDLMRERRASRRP